jgi:heme A synthase
MLVMGSILVGIGALVVGLLALLFRHPRAPGWTKPEPVAMLALIPVTGMLGLGLGYILAGCYRLLQGAGDVYELGAPLAAAVAIAALWQLSGIRGRLEAYDAASVGAGSGTDPAATAISLPVGAPGAPAPRRPTHRPAGKAA